MAVPGVTESLIELLINSNSSSVVQPALRCIGNFVTGSKDSMTQKCLDSNLMSAFPRLLNHTKRSIRKEATWALSNIAAGTKNQVQSIISFKGDDDNSTGASIMR